MKPAMKVPRALLSLPFLFVITTSCAAQEPHPSPTPEEFQTRLESQRVVGHRTPHGVGGDRRPLGEEGAGRRRGDKRHVA